MLRFWESKFSDITPIKRGGGRRFYRPEDIEFLRGIKTLLYDEKHPIKDVQKLIAKSGAARIVELGRSVEQASRERDIADTNLVPQRIEKPKVKAVKSAVKKPAKATETVMEVAPSPPEPRDLSGLQDALGRLEALRTKWDEFDAAE